MSRGPAIERWRALHSIHGGSRLTTPTLVAVVPREVIRPLLVTRARGWSRASDPRSRPLKAEERRLSFAYALLATPHRLFSDKASEAFDSATEAAIWRLILTRVPASHKPSVVRSYGRRVAFSILTEPQTA
jgi:ABC-type transport system involved in Fe-S cluster assembly fused permease/ATPase subunit